jgi:hypothetical protein
MTYSVALTNAIALTEGETRETLERLLAQVQKRNSTENRKPTKVQEHDASLAEIVHEVLTDAGKPLTITEIIHADERLSPLSNQKVNAVVRSMGDAVVKVPDKRVNRFTLA